MHTLKERALHPLRRTGYDELRALRGVSFEVAPGEFFGVVGRNGSGKSTLLKCIAGIYRSDAGRIELDGRLSSFIELGVGFNPDLAAYDNVVLNATMLGLPPREARDRYERVIAFAELEKFQDLKLKNYSSGMLVRLAFAVMIQVDADILLIDEVLAVGDAAFQQKCFDEFERIRRDGKTVVLVTHDMAAVRRFCDRAVLLERGRVVELGDPIAVGNSYLELNFSEEARAEAEAETPTPRSPGQRRLADRSAGDGRAAITHVVFLNAGNEPSEVLPSADKAALGMRVTFHEDVEEPTFAVSLHNGRGDLMLEATSLDRVERTSFRAGDVVDVRVHFDNFLAPDRYHLTVTVSDAHGWLDRRERVTSVVVTGTDPSGALVDLPYTVGLHRVGEQVEQAS